jgi:hypothetical protein
LSAIAMLLFDRGDIEHRRAELFGQLPNLAAHFLSQRASRLLSGSSIKSIFGLTAMAGRGDALLLAAGERSQSAREIFQLDQTQASEPGWKPLARFVGFLRLRQRDILINGECGQTA